MATVSDAAGEEGLRGPLVCKAVGITYRQLDYWARTGLVRPSVRDASGSGSQRLYSFADVVQLRVVKRLIDTGVSLPKVRKAIEYVRDHLNVSLEDVILVSDGHSIYAHKSPDEVLDLLQQGQAVFGIAVGKVYEELQGTIAELRRSEPAEGAETPPAKAGG